MGGRSIALGDVYRWANDDRPVRVLLHDGDVVLLDGWLPHLDNWSMADLRMVRRTRCSYVVTFTATVLEKAAFLRSAPLTEEERALHRPDLPFAVAQHADRSWGEPDLSEDAGAGGGLRVAEVYLAPFGPRGGGKRPVRVKADDGVAFTAAELLRKGGAIQRPFPPEPPLVPGVGIYRLGLVRGVPEYYLWGAESMLHSHVRQWQERMARQG